jgi:hypothetical protein
VNDECSILPIVIYTDWALAGAKLLIRRRVEAVDFLADELHELCRWSMHSNAR